MNHLKREKTRECCKPKKKEKRFFSRVVPLVLVAVPLLRIRFGVVRELHGLRGWESFGGVERAPFELFKRRCRRGLSDLSCAALTILLRAIRLGLVHAHAANGADSLVRLSRSLAGAVSRGVTTSHVGSWNRELRARTVWLGICRAG